VTTKRLFFALWPDPHQRDHLRDVIMPLAKGVEGRAVGLRNWHVTLAFIGAFPEQQIPLLQEKAGDIHVEPFRLVFDRLEYWSRPRVATLCAATVPPELHALVDGLHGVMLDLGLRPEERKYRPHITVLRKARAFTTEQLAGPVITEWSNFELVESVSGPGGVSYVPLKQ
jgi:2'-5' RNA ligase